MAARLHVANIGSAEKIDLEELFARWDVKSVEIKTSKIGRRYAYVTLASAEKASEAIRELNDSQRFGSRLAVKIDQPQQRHPKPIAASQPTEPRQSFAPQRKSGTVKWFNEVKGFGYIRCGGDDIFIHISDIADHRAPGPGDVLEFNVVVANRGPKATNVILAAPSEQALQNTTPAVSAPDAGLGHPVFLCSSPTRDTTDAPAMSLDDLRLSLPPPLAEAVAAYVQVTSRPLPSGPDAALSWKQYLEGLKDTVEPTLRYFLWTFYCELLRTDSVPDELQRQLSRDYPLRTLLNQNSGETYHRTVDVVRSLKRRLSTISDLVKSGLTWWDNHGDAFRAYVHLRNAANKSHDLQDTEHAVTEMLTGIKAALLQIQDLGWCLVAGTDPPLALTGPDPAAWQVAAPLDPDNSLSLFPFALFHSDNNTLDIFQNTSRNHRAYKYRRFGAEPGERTAGSALTREIEKYVPIGEWYVQSGLLKANLAFPEERAGLAVTLHGRDKELSEVLARAYLVPSAGSGRLVVIGEQGVGKSAFLAKVHDHLSRAGSHGLLYFFRYGDDDRCRLSEFVNAACIALEPHLPLDEADPWRMPDTDTQPKERLEKVFRKIRDLRNVQPFTLVVDGLDELAARRRGDLTQLLDLIHSSPDSLRWICSSRRAISDLAPLAAPTFTPLPLARLDPESAVAVLEDELSTLDSAIRAEVATQAWVERVLSNPDGTLPLYLKEVVASVRAGHYRNPEGVPPTMVEHWRRTMERIELAAGEIPGLPKGFASRVVLCLSLTYAPLSAYELKQITGREVPADVFLLDTAFRKAEDRWAIASESFRQYLREHNDWSDERTATFWQILKWARKWGNESSSYPLANLPRHLQESHDFLPADDVATNREELRQLAGNDAFLFEQTKRFPRHPEIAVETLRRALTAACEDLHIREAILLAFREARELSRQSYARIVADIYAGNFAAAAERALLREEPREHLIWRLLSATAAVNASDHDAALRVLVDTRVEAHGTEPEYEEIVAILLAVLMCADYTMLRKHIVRIAADSLGDTGRMRLLASLWKIDAAPYMVPNGARRARLLALRSLASAIGRTADARAVLDLADKYPEFAIVIRIYGSIGCVEAGRYRDAVLVASGIADVEARRTALCNVASAVAASEGTAADVANILRFAADTWQKADDDQATYDDVFSRNNDLSYDFLEEISELTTSASRAERVRIRALLGSIQTVMRVDGESFFDLAEKEVALLFTSDQDALLWLGRAYLRAQRYGDARNALFATHDFDRQNEVRAAELARMSVSDLRELPDSTVRSRRQCMQTASALARSGHPAHACELILRHLLVANPIGQMKQRQPWQWGNPRLLGEIGGALLRLGAEQSARRYFRSAEEALDSLSDDWLKDHAWGLLNLAQAMLSSPTGTDRMAGVCLHIARMLVAPRQRAFKSAAAAAEVLSEIWAIMRSGRIPLHADVLAHAKAVAESGPLSDRVAALLEIARRLFPAGETDDARAVVSRARSIIESEPESRERTAAKAVFLQYVSRTGALSKLELVNIGNEISSFIANVRGAGEWPVKWRSWAQRGEVERQLALGDVAAARTALDAVEDEKTRSHAARSIATYLVSTGAYDKALRLIDEAILASRGELIADVAKALAPHVRANAALAEDARRLFLRLLEMIAPHLDGTFRVASSMIASGAFPELTSGELEQLGAELALEADVQENASS
jgi:CspA family cold shock protein